MSDCPRFSGLGDSGVSGMRVVCLHNLRGIRWRFGVWVRTDWDCQLLGWVSHQYRHRRLTKLAGCLDIVGQSCRKMTFIVFCRYSLGYGSVGIRDVVRQLWNR